MKKLLALLMALILCLPALVACDTTDGEDVEYAVADAAAYLNSMYINKAAETPVDYDVVAQVMVNKVTYTVTWKVDNDKIKIVESSKNGFYTVDVPDVVEEEIPYVLTATIKAGDGTSATKSFNRVVPVVDNSDIIGEPEENVAYKIYLKQGNLEQTLYASHEISDGKYYKGVLDPVEAPDFYAEKAGEGYKFYTMIDGVKSYVRAYLFDTPTGPSKRLDYSATEGTVWTYRADCNAWFTTIDGGSYVFGTYSSYNTFCISDGTFMTPESSGTTQFPAELILKEDAEALSPSEPPVNNDPEADTTLTVAEAIALGESKKHDIYTAGKYYVTGEITEIYNTQYGNMKIKDAEGNILTVYGTFSADGSTRFDAMTSQPAVGDTITVYGIIGQYNGTPQLKNGWITSVVPGEGGDDSGDDPEPPVNNDPAADTVLSIADAIALGASKAHDTYTEGKYYVTGEITEIYNTQYGNMKIKDADGNILTIYGTYNADGTVRFDAMETKPAVGDTVTIYGKIGQYNGTAQIKNGWITTEPAGGEDGGEDDGEDDGETDGMTIAEALAAASGTDVVLTGTVVDIYQAWNPSYNNISVYIQDANGDRILAYRMGTMVYVGDVITVTGTITVYNELNQIAQGCTATVVSAHTCADYATDATCTSASVCSSCNAELAPALTHPTDEDNDGLCDNCGLSTSIVASTETLEIIAATGVTGNKTISWTGTAVTFTNNQGSSTSAIRTDDADHFRCYKSSDVVISSNNGEKITKLVIAATGEAKHKTAWQDSFEAAGYTVTVDGNNYIVEFDEGVTEITLTAAAQMRLTSITVTYIA